MANPGTRFHNFRRFTQTVKHLSLCQIFFRARRIARKSWYKASKTRAPHPNGDKALEFHPLYCGLSDLPHYLDSDERLDAVTRRAVAIRNLEFEFLNKKAQFKDSPDWHGQYLSHLWRYHLHYFDYCDELLMDSFFRGDSACYTAFKNIAKSWIHDNAILRGDGWHPFTLSARIVNWLNALSGFNECFAADGEFKNLLLGSLAGQLKVLSNDLEFDVRGNHLIKNLKALVFGSSVFSSKESQRWYEKAITFLQVEIKEQILADGGHFERNPGYHLVVLKDLLECAIWIERNRDTRYPWLDNCLGRMLDWLIAVAVPENRLPLIKDTTRDNTYAIADIVSAGALYFDSSRFKQFEKLGLYPFLLYGKDGNERFEQLNRNDRPAEAIALQASGFYLMRDDVEKDMLAFDAGKACPDYLPAHAHADMLSYELVVGGRSVIVDSGVYEYTSGRWRDYFRSTRAHNTVEINRRNQSDVWSSFRVANRAHPFSVKWQSGRDSILVQASHDGYRKTPDHAIHRRTILWQKGLFWLVLDSIIGSKLTEAVSYIHFHPAIRIYQEDASMWRLGDDAAPIRVTAFGHTKHAVCCGQVEPSIQGWHSEKFGEKEPNKVIALHNHKKAPFHFGYVISKETPANVALCADSGFLESIVVSHGKRDFTFRFTQGDGS